MAKIILRECPVSRFKILMVDKFKLSCGEDTANAGFFGPYHEGKDEFTLPAGHLVCDNEATSKWIQFYGEKRGNFVNGKSRYDAAKGIAGDNLTGKTISTLVIKDGKASIIDIATLPECDYAICGVPVLRNGGDCKWGAYVTKQGWSAGTVRATWHTFVGVKDDPTVVWVIGMKTTTDNMVKTSEAFNAFKALGFVDVIKVDGGGSFYFNDGGNITATEENRRINTIFSFGDDGEAKDGGYQLALSAGHGIHTNGKRMPAELDPDETREWQLNDRVCDYIEEELAAYDGIRIMRLDDSDDGEVNVQLPDRVAAANAWPANLYLSIHHNALGRVFDGGGIVAYAHTKPKGDSLEWRDELYEELIERTGLKGNRATPKAQSDLYVLRKTNMAAVLLELGFMDSRSDAPVILTDDYARSCAKDIAAVIVRRWKLQPKRTIEAADNWAAAAWEKAHAAGIMDGTRPRDAVSRQELAVILRALELT